MPRPPPQPGPPAGGGAADAEPEGESVCLREERAQEHLEQNVVSAPSCDDVAGALRELELHVVGEVERVLALLELRALPRPAKAAPARAWKSEGDVVDLVDLSSAKLETEAYETTCLKAALPYTKTAGSSQSSGILAAGRDSPAAKRRSFRESRGNASMSESELWDRSVARNSNEDRIFMPHSFFSVGSISSEGGTRIQKLVTSHSFEIFWIGCVLASSILIGVQTQYAAMNTDKEEPAAFMYIQCCFTVLFLVELLLRIAGNGLTKLFCGPSKGWAWLDLLLVLASLFELAVETILPSLMAQDESMNASSMRTVRVIRLARSIRALRVQRLIRLVNSLRTLVYSIGATLKSLIWALVLLTIIMYMAGVALTQGVVDYITFGDPDMVLDEGLNEFWSSLNVSMFTLFQSISGGLSWHDAAKPLSGVSNLLVAVFAAYISFTYFAVLNVVTGVFCHSAIESAQRNPDVVAQSLLANQKCYVQNIEKLFSQVDEDRNHFITLNELERAIANPQNRAVLSALEIEALDAWTFFKLLDIDQDGAVQFDEFVAGCLKLKGLAKNVDVANLCYCMDRLDRKVSKYMNYVEEVSLNALSPLPSAHSKFGLLQSR